MRSRSKTPKTRLCGNPLTPARDNREYCVQENLIFYINGVFKGTKAGGSQSSWRDYIVKCSDKHEMINSSADLSGGLKRKPFSGLESITVSRTDNRLKVFIYDFNL